MDQLQSLQEQLKEKPNSSSSNDNSNNNPNNNSGHGNTEALRAGHIQIAIEEHQRLQLAASQLKAADERVVKLETRVCELQDKCSGEFESLDGRGRQQAARDALHALGRTDAAP